MENRPERSLSGSTPIIFLTERMKNNKRRPTERHRLLNGLRPSGGCSLATSPYSLCMEPLMVDVASAPHMTTHNNATGAHAAPICSVRDTDRAFALETDLATEFQQAARYDCRGRPPKRTVGHRGTQDRAVIQQVVEIHVGPDTHAPSADDLRHTKIELPHPIAKH